MTYIRLRCIISYRRHSQSENDIEIMAKKTKDDITLETLYELKDLISEAIENIEKAEKAEEGDPRSLIDRVEDCLIGLNDKTRNIYASMISEHLSSIETSDMIESKKANTSKRG